VAGLFDRAPALTKRNRRPVDSPAGLSTTPHRRTGALEKQRYHPAHPIDIVTSSTGYQELKSGLLLIQ